MTLSRRKLLQSTIFGAGLAGLRSLVTGLPKSFLLGGSVAHAAEPVPPQYLILQTSTFGDPINVNAPGAYVAGAENNPHPELAPANITLGETSAKGAKVWNTLPAALRSRMSFFHHGTFVNAHSEHRKVMTLNGSAKTKNGSSQEMLASVFASEAAEALGTVQVEPVPLGAERLTFEGRALDNIDPSGLKALFAEPDALLESLTKLRDQELDALYANLRQNGTRTQRQFLDRYALGREQVRSLSGGLASLLERLPVDPDVKDSPEDQVIAAVALFKLNVTPVVSIHVPFGADNHADPELLEERDQTLTGVATLQFLWDELAAQGLQDRVTFCSFNTFGRELKRNGSGGRDHNQNHHTA
ncbi:MAG TPA: hypothetical protein VM686_25425, partial [Polyangiaceae bacterium]|nr:hypothetical protein [Polyangiaceae bacterium]